PSAPGEDFPRLFAARPRNKFRQRASNRAVLRTASPLRRCYRGADGSPCPRDDRLEDACENSVLGFRLHPKAIGAGLREGVREGDFLGHAGLISVIAVEGWWKVRLAGIPVPGFGEEFLGGHGESPERVQVRENRPI